MGGFSERSEEKPLLPKLSPGMHHSQCPPPETYIKGGAVAGTPKAPPSGTWRGYYNQYGRDHSLCDFSLQFEDGLVSGTGVDNVGHYTITGVYGGPGGRIAFAKEYQAGSTNESGVENRVENLGHLAEYRAEPAGPELGQGLKGTWYVKTHSYTGSGGFHLWPDVDLYSPEAVEAGSAFVRDHPTFEVSSNNVCAVCFDDPIDVVIDPCGHIVVCAGCAGRLNPRKCPICRDGIRRVLPATDRTGEGVRL